MNFLCRQCNCAEDVFEPVKIDVHILTWMFDETTRKSKNISNRMLTSGLVYLLFTLIFACDSGNNSCQSNIFFEFSSNSRTAETCDSCLLMRNRVANMIHQRCTRGLYPSSNIQRFEVPEDKIPWSVEFLEYEPQEFNSLALEGKPWADPEIDDPLFKPKWNCVDGEVNRQSYEKEYEINKVGRPLNPIGRTGIIGRGLLGRWGPNHAADPIVTRWKRNGTGALEIHRVTEKPIIQFVAIERRDSKAWAIPGGMVDPGEKIADTLKREFIEEALNSLDTVDEEKQEMMILLDSFFARGDEIYRGYVDDPRNTDNAWIETIALNFHDEEGTTLGGVDLKAGDDASDVKWIDVDRKVNLYANHGDFIERVARKRNAHW